MLSGNDLYPFISLLALLFGALGLWLSISVRKDRLHVRCDAGILIITNREMLGKRKFTYYRIHEVGLVRKSRFGKVETLSMDDAHSVVHRGKVPIWGLSICGPHGEDRIRLRMDSLLQLWIAQVIEQCARLHGILETNPV